MLLPCFFQLYHAATVIFSFSMFLQSFHQFFRSPPWGPWEPLWPLGETNQKLYMNKRDKQFNEKNDNHLKDTNTIPLKSRVARRGFLSKAGTTAAVAPIAGFPLVSVSIDGLVATPWFPRRRSFSAVETRTVRSNRTCHTCRRGVCHWFVDIRCSTDQNPLP